MVFELLQIAVCFQDHLACTPDFVRFVAPEVLGSMSARRKRTLSALQITTQLTIKGGLLLQPRILDSRPVMFDGREVQFVPVASSEDWVCQMASGKGAHTRPLARCKVLAELRRKAMEPVRESGDASGDPMGDLAFDDAIPVPLRLLAPLSAYRSKQLKREAPIVEQAVVAVLMKACPGASADAEPTRVLILMCGLKMLMEVSALPWLLNYLVEELHSLDILKNKRPLIWWDPHNDCWAGRIKTPDGKNLRKTASVRYRRIEGADLCDLSFEAAKTVVYQELLGFYGVSDKQGAPAVVDFRS
jgi:hypothetical protein